MQQWKKLKEKLNKRSESKRRYSFPLLLPHLLIFGASSSSHHDFSSYSLRPLPGPDFYYQRRYHPLWACQSSRWASALMIMSRCKWKLCSHCDSNVFTGATWRTSKNRCVNLPAWFNDQASSVHTHDGCMVIFEVSGFVLNFEAIFCQSIIEFAAILAQELSRRLRLYVGGHTRPFRSRLSWLQRSSQLRETLLMQGTKICVLFCCINLWDMLPISFWHSKRLIPREEGLFTSTKMLTRRRARSVPSDRRSFTCDIVLRLHEILLIARLTPSLAFLLKRKTLQVWKRSEKYARAVSVKRCRRRSLSPY